MEYWAFVWGTAVMAISGFLLWFNKFALRHFPKWITEAATAVHWHEALLATFSILLRHFYMVIFDPLIYPMDTAWLDGKVPADHYRDSRPAYLHALKRAGLAKSENDQAPGPANPESMPELQVPQKSAPAKKRAINPSPARESSSLRCRMRLTSSKFVSRFTHKSENSN